MNPSRLPYLDSFRAVAVAMVVGVHVFGYVKFGSQETSDLIWFIIYPIAVPIFFLVDGYLFSMKQLEGRAFEYRSYILKSAKRLLIPWIAFNLIYTIFRWSVETAGLTTERIIVGATPGQILLQVYTSSIAPQMYFLLSLFLVRSLTFLHRRIALAEAWIVISIFIAYTTFYRGYFQDVYKAFFPLPGLDPVLHAFWGLQYYLLGIVLFKLRDQLAKFAPVIAGSAFALMVGLKFVILYPSYLLQYTYLIFGFCLFVAIGDKGSVLSKIGTHTMGIYLLHAPILLGGMVIIGRLMSHDPLAIFMMVWAGTFLSAWVLTKIIQSAPLGQLMLGGLPMS
jgi:fucose 4-O-acetylase-like acetyltransferase